jgi:eukaryotic-like serine/threonine-protein kinase
MSPVVAPSSNDLAPGVAFGSYVVKELIGRGGMAAVYRAEHMLLNKPVALKVMDRGLLASSAARQRFLLEGRAVAAIKHPNVVDIADVGVQDGVPYLVMELLTGEDLAAHLEKRPPLDDASAIRLALPVIAALHAAHSSGVVHRDIKPSNIFLSQGPDDQVVPKVLDFGISKVSFDNSRLDLLTTPQNQIIGTPRYLPPEALHGARELGPQSDQYSLGVVLYQCVTGTTPFSGDTLISLLNSLSRGAFEPPRSLQPSISPGLERIISRALSPEPNDRFPSVRDMGRALLELAAERTQMVWGHSFRPSLSSGDELATPRLGALPPATELIERDQLSVRGQRVRRWALGVGLMSLGALASALWSAFAATPSGRQSIEGLSPVRQEAAVIALPLNAPPVIAPPAGSSDAPAPAPRPSNEESRVNPDASGSSRARPARSQTRRPGNLSRRAEKEAKTRDAASAKLAAPAVKREAHEVSSAPDVGPARPAPASAARRQGANRSPLLD